MDCEKKPELIGPLLGYCNHRAYLSMDKCGTMASRPSSAGP